VLKLSEGQFDGQPFRLEPSQAFIIGSVFGWKRKDGRRRFRRAYIEQGKGNGKSPVAGGIGLYGMTACNEAGAQIYAAAAKREQAGILFADAVKMVRQSPALAKRLEFSGGAGREFNIAHHGSGSFFRAVSRDTGRTGSGPRPYFVLADEIHELPDRSIIEMLERGFKFRRDPLLFMITNSGSNRNSVAWEEHEHAIKVAAGNIDAVTEARKLYGTFEVAGPADNPVILGWAKRHGRTETLVGVQGYLDRRYRQPLGRSRGTWYPARWADPDRRPDRCAGADRHR